MSRQANGKFDLVADEQPWVQEGRLRLTRTRMAKTFHGDMNGETVAELLMAYVLPESADAIGFEDFAAAGGTGAYVGFERFSGTVAGRCGSFVLQHNLVGDAKTPTAPCAILPGSGTGELEGIRGRLTIEPRPHDEPSLHPRLRTRLRSL